MNRTASVTRHIAAEPDAVFGLVIDIARQPQWQASILEVVERPASMRVGARWVLVIHMLGSTFRADRRALVVDGAARRFAYRCNPEGQRSFSLWTWSVEPERGGSRVRVEWELNPATLLDRLFYAPLILRVLPSQLRLSLAALERVLLAEDASISRATG
jgi:uncharacterized protein YndB with AHSA1/START domain